MKIKAENYKKITKKMFFLLICENETSEENQFLMFLGWILRLLKLHPLRFHRNVLVSHQQQQRFVVQSSSTDAQHGQNHGDGSKHLQHQ